MAPSLLAAGAVQQAQLGSRGRKGEAVPLVKRQELTVGLEHVSSIGRLGMGSLLAHLEFAATPPGWGLVQVRQEALIGGEIVVEVESGFAVADRDLCVVAAEEAIPVGGVF